MKKELNLRMKTVFLMSKLMKPIKRSKICKKTSNNSSNKLNKNKLELNN